MKRQLLFLTLLISGLMLFSACANHSDINKTTSTFYLIQPAEHFHAFNGHLNWYGRLRSGDLMRFLKDSGVHAIYRTTFTRAIETTDSLQKLQKIDVVSYNIDSVADNIFKLLRQNEDFGRKILLVCPPQEMSAVMNKLGVKTSGHLAHKNQFNAIYIIVNNHGKANVTPKAFGKLPRPVQDTTSQKNNGLD